LDAAQAQLHQLRLEARRATDRQRVLDERDERTTRELVAARQALADAERARDEAVAARAAVVEQMMAVPAPAPAARRPPAAARGRRPIALPGGLVGSSRAAAEFLMRVPGVVVLVDGYNVAKLGWPGLSLEAQRDRCVAAAEDVVLRFGGVDVRIVFDGADVPGIPAGLRRLVPVHFSPEGVKADAVLCAEAARLPVTTPVVVVTDDREVLDDVRGSGANGLSSATWLDLAGHRSSSR
jgi:predicted RNA-binding protein with PIN domain